MVALAQIGKINPDQISQEALENVPIIPGLGHRSQADVHPCEDYSRHLLHAHVLHLQQDPRDLLLHCTHSTYLTKKSHGHV